MRARCVRCGSRFQSSGTRICGHCPEPLATPSQVLDGKNIDTCRLCGIWVRVTSTNSQQKGDRVCIECAMPPTVTCQWAWHSGNRNVLASHVSSLSVRTVARGIRQFTVCNKCLKDSRIREREERSELPFTEDLFVPVSLVMQPIEFGSIAEPQDGVYRVVGFHAIRRVGRTFRLVSLIDDGETIPDVFSYDMTEKGLISQCRIRETLLAIYRENTGNINEFATITGTMVEFRDGKTVRVQRP